MRSGERLQEWHLAGIEKDWMVQLKEAEKFVITKFWKFFNKFNLLGQYRCNSTNVQEWLYLVVKRAGITNWLLLMNTIARLTEMQVKWLFFAFLQQRQAVQGAMVLLNKNRFSDEVCYSNDSDQFSSIQYHHSLFPIFKICIPHYIEVNGIICNVI